MRLVAVLVLSAALSLPLLSPAPAQAGIITLPPPSDTTCPEETAGPISILLLQQPDLPPRFRGLYRAASAADVNHNGLVCAVRTGQGERSRGFRFLDDIPLIVG